MKHIIIFLILISTLAHSQDSTFNDNQYFKLINHYQDKTELFNNGYTEFDLRKDNWYGEGDVKRLQEKNPKLKNFGILISPDNKFLFGMKYVVYTGIDSLVFFFFFFVVTKLIDSPKKEEVISNRFITSNSEYIYLYYRLSNILYVYDKNGNLQTSKNIVSNKYIRYLFLSNDASNLIYTYNTNQNLFQGENICYSDIMGNLEWSVFIDSIYTGNVCIYDDIVVLFGLNTTSESRSNNIKKLVILNRETGNTLYNDNKINFIYFLPNGFIIMKNNKYYEYEILN